MMRFMLNKKTVDLALGIAGLAVAIATEAVNEKKTERKIREKVNEALSKRDMENGGES